jgi:hypothetical protein
MLTGKIGIALEGMLESLLVGQLEPRQIHLSQPAPNDIQGIVPLLDN